MKIGKALLGSIMILALSGCSQSKGEWTEEEKLQWATENGYIKGETALENWATTNGYLKGDTALSNWALSNGYLKDEAALANWAIAHGYLKDETALANWAVNHGYIKTPTTAELEAWASSNGYLKGNDLIDWAITNGYLKDEAALENWAITNGYLKDETALANWAITNGYLKDEAALANWAVSHGYIIQPTDEEYAAWAEDHGYTKLLGAYNGLYQSDATSLNYMNTNREENVSVFSNLVDGLVETDHNGVIQPALATSWEQDETDGRIWTFKIRKGVKWVDNKGVEVATVTAHDWVSAIRYAINSDEINYLITDHIKNASEYLMANAYLEATTDEERINTKFFETFATGYDESAALAEEPSIIWNSSEDEEAFNALLEEYASFDSVGVRAIDDYTLEFTTLEVQNYFLSLLLLSAYYPVNADFVESVGFDNFGSSAETILYCGAYLLDEWIDSSRIVLKKNEKYWDKYKVSIETINLIKYNSSNDGNVAWARSQYENGIIDSFELVPGDTEGWIKYVTGSNGTGTIDNPVSDEVQIVENEMGSGLSFLLFLNRNFDFSWTKTHPQYFKTTLTEAEVDNGNVAMSNVNLRKALLYGMDRTYVQEKNWDSNYSNKDQYLSNTFVPKSFVGDDEGKDYVEYYADVYARKKGISLDSAKTITSPGYDGLTNLELADTYMLEAKEELLEMGLSLPIKLEYLGLPDADSVAYDNAAIAKWNEDLKLADGTQVVKIVRNDAIETQMQYLYSSNYNVGHITTMGWGPDYADPLTYLDTLTRTGTFGAFAGIDVLEDGEDLLIEEYERLIEVANSKTNISERLEAFAEAEYYAWHEAAIAIPWEIPGRGSKVVVTRVNNEERMKGFVTGYKYKYMTFK